MGLVVGVLVAGLVLPFVVGNRSDVGVTSDAGDQRPPRQDPRRGVLRIHSLLRRVLPRIPRAVRRR